MAVRWCYVRLPRVVESLDPQVNGDNRKPWIDNTIAHAASSQRPILSLPRHSSRATDDWWSRRACNYFGKLAPASINCNEEAELQIQKRDPCCKSLGRRNVDSACWRRERLPVGLRRMGSIGGLQTLSPLRGRISNNPGLQL